MPARAKKAATAYAVPSRGSELNIAFGLVNVPAKYAPLIASGSGRVRGTTLCTEHLAPIRQQKVCTEGGEVCAETVIGYEHAGRYVVVEKDDLKLARDKRLELQVTCDVADVDPLYFEKPYLMWPQAGAESAFDLLAAALRETRKCAVGVSVVSDSTKVLVIRWSDDHGCLLLHACTYAERIAWDSVQLVAEGLRKQPGVEPKALGMAISLLDSLDGAFDFADVVDEYDAALRERIAAAVDGKPIPVVEHDSAPAATVDLMAALEASMAKAGKPPKKTAAKKPRAKAAA